VKISEAKAEAMNNRLVSSSVTIQISPESKPSTPSWMAEVAAFTQVLEHTDILRAIQGQVRFARARFGHLFLSSLLELISLRIPWVYGDQGRYTEAEPLFLRTLAIQEQQLGSEHPDTAISLNGLANLYSQQGKYEQAETFYQRVLAIQEQRLGATHPETSLAKSIHAS
jgi:tetratricopeptide (TPR) repeat protein